MAYTVTITSQGQISIPVHLRRKLGLDITKKALVTEKDGKILIEPIKDLLELKGSLKTRISGSPIRIRQAFENYTAQKKSRAK
jgi:AbrB family looped-hinge helix DNA binding protein